jgi:CRISPR type III-A-associated RAMP protein Csm4
MKQSFTIARLRPLAPFHFSKGAEDYSSSEEVWRSDSIKSALFAVGMQLFGPEKMRKSFFDSFFLSSAFPYFQDEYFFPKPMLRLPLASDGSIGEAKLSKKLKKIQYLGKSLFEKAIAKKEEILNEKWLLQGGTFASEKFSHAENGDAIVFGADLQQRIRIYKEYETEIVEAPSEEGKVRVERGKSPDTFYVEKIYFSQQAGLFILFGPMDEETRELVGALMHYLGETGIGKNKHFGFGRFAFEGFDRLDLNLPDSGDAWLNLGLYCPAGDERGPVEITPEILANSAYGLIRRGGWLASSPNEANLGLRKKSIYMFQEGSVFAFEERLSTTPILGKCVNLKPDFDPGHDVWREGRSLFFPVRI